MADQTVFIIRDFEVDRSVGLALQYLAKYPPAGTKLSIPGIPGAAEQGRLIEDVVDSALAKSQYVISFMDTPNANVGFELGFALGSDRHVALVCAAAELPQWLDAAPLSGYLIVKGVQLPKLQKMIENGEHFNVNGSPLPGTDLLFLCPREGEGLIGHQLVTRLYPDWRSPQKTGWKLQDLPKQLDRVGEVVWLITPFGDGADRKDGQGNSLNAVIAGYAKGKGIPLRILKSTHHRRIADIEDRALLFTNLDELHNLLREAEEKRKVAVAARIVEQEPEPETTLEKVITPAEPVSNTAWYRSALEIFKAIGRVSIASTAQATCFLVSDRHVLTPWHVISSAKDISECVVDFERTTAKKEVRRAKALTWTSGSTELDVTMVELEAPITDAFPLSLIQGETFLVPGEGLAVVGYPHGGALSLSLSTEGFVKMSDQFVHYPTFTVVPSSGSPIFDLHWNLLGMHHAEIHGPKDQTLNEGIRTSAIRAALDRAIPTLRTSWK